MPFGFAKLCTPWDKCVIGGAGKGAVAPNAFAGLGPVSQPPSGLQRPATGCLMHEADVGRVWKGLALGPASFRSLFSPVPP